MKTLLYPLLLLVLTGGLSSADEVLRAGAVAVDISPRTLPAIRNGGFLQATSDRVDGFLHARCLVLSDGKETIAIAIVDSCMFPTDVCDAIKERVNQQIGLPTNRILISATHTHSAPSVMSMCLGTGRDEAYTLFVVPQVAEGIVAAHQKMQPAKIGWTAVDAGEYTHCRRWITRGDRMGNDPFGQRTVRAMMHPGYLNPNYVCPAGPIDPQLSLLSVVAANDDTPLCLMANFSMHYFGAGGGFSADYFGEVASRFESRIAEVSGKPADDFVGIMSQGTSGDLHWMNYGDSRRSISRQNYAQAVAEKALDAWQQIQHRSDVSLSMCEQRVELGRRLPDAERLAWAKPINDQRGDQPPRNQVEVYAQQAQWIRENPVAEVVLQAVRIGDLGIAAMPNEVYGITGLKIKKQSPLAHTFNLELANGAEGYIPPPEQHRLGGYTTWPARTAGLDVRAEPKIVEVVLSLLELVSSETRREHLDPPSAYSRAVMAAKPAAYWRLGDIVSDSATDATGDHHATYEGGVALHLSGPDADEFDPATNRCVYLAGGSLQAKLPELPNDCTVSFWFWNGLPAESAGQLGTLYARGSGDQADALKIVANDDGVATLVFESQLAKLTGPTPLVTRAWHQTTIINRSSTATVYLDGQLQFDCERVHNTAELLTFGRFDGKLDEVAVFDRQLSPAEIKSLYRASGMKPPKRPPPPVMLGEKPSDPASLQRYADAVRASKPLAYWRLHDGDNTAAKDDLGKHDGQYEPNSQPRLPGSATQSISGGRVLAKLSGLNNQYSVELWMRNEQPNTSRLVTGYLFTRGVDRANGAPGDNLGIGGTHAWTGRLFVFNGNQRDEAVVGKTAIVRGSWNHVVMTRDGTHVKAFLNGQLEFAGPLPITYPDGCDELQIGGRNDNFANFQGMIDEVAVYDRVLTAAEVKAHFDVAGAQQVSKPKTEQHEQPQPTPADSSLENIHVRAGYRVELVASEPQIKDPVAIDWGSDGRLWVVEMADYPLGIDGEGKPGGRIRVLADRDDDGHYETSSLFAHGLPFPTGILVWGDGVIVTAAPEIVYLEDSTGDGKADIRRTLLKGFLEGNQQLRVNGLRLGLDNWVHCASGSHHSGYGKGNQITSAITGTKHQIGSRDFRIRPDTGEIDPLSGPSQYGRNRDDWGNWFGVQNSRPLWHYVLADQDIRRNPHFAPPDPIQQVVTPLNPPVYPAAPLQKRFHSFDQSGRFTSACSAMIYRDDLLFPRKGGQQHAFTCEPFHNLVQHNLIFDDGVSFRFQRDPAESKVDFFASKDRWCRPVMARTGPDGALWIVDMYRYMIEHPQWLPQNGKDELRPYYRLGEHQGRIYRVVPTNEKDREFAALDRYTTMELVATLSHSNGWTRDTAQRMLIHRRDAAAIGALGRAVTSDRGPLLTLHALCTLDGLDSLTAEILQVALTDKHPGVRRQALRLAANHHVDVKHLAALVNDPDAKVRLQLAATLGAYADSLAAQTLAELAAQSASDAYITANVFSSLNQHNVAEVLTALLAKTANEPALSEDQRQLQSQLFGQVAALGDAKSIGIVVGRTCGQPGDQYQAWQFDHLADLLDGLSKRNFALDSLTLSERSLINQAIEAARLTVDGASEESSPLIAGSIRLLLRQKDHDTADRRRLAELLVPQSGIDLQLAVVNRFAQLPDATVPAILLSPWKAYGPTLRSRVLEVLASRTAWSRELHAHVAAKHVLLADISPTMRERFLATKDKDLKSEWEKVFASGTSSDRKRILNEYQSALTLSGNQNNGIKVFEKQCAACHRIGKLGHDVGPNLASITDKRPEAFLAAILDPSAAVEARYVSYIVLTEDGQIHTGLLATETGSSITLRNVEGKQETILRSEIEELHASGHSLMPDGMEKVLTPQDIADVIRFVSGHRLD